MPRLGSINVHPDRRGTGTAPLKYAVLHTSEQASDGVITDDAMKLCRFMTMPGDRMGSSGRPYGASYNFVVDTDGWWDCTSYPANQYPYAAPPVNQSALHLCFPARIGLTRDEWSTGDYRRMISTCAELLVFIEKSYGIPATRVSEVDMLSGIKKGYCDHGNVSAVWHKSDHTDVGGNFPWELLLQDIQFLQTPPVTPPAKPPADYGLPRPVLAVGATGVEVLKLQQVLTFWGWYTDKVDGIYGALTAAGVTKMQLFLNNNGYQTGVPDGNYSWLEWTALGNWYNHLSTLGGK